MDPQISLFDLSADHGEDALPEPTVRERMLTLRSLLAEANRAYYVLDDPSLSDAEYDRLRSELEGLERDYPLLTREVDGETGPSPTRQVGTETGPSPFGKVALSAPMLSLDNAFDEEALDRWMARETDEAQASVFYCELKIDGLALELRYQEGRLVRAATRGNGTIGEDVTANALAAPGIPSELAEGAPAQLIVRGEAYMPTSGFLALNRARTEAGEPPFKTPRNAAAGSLRQKDPSVTARRPLGFFGYSVQSPTGDPLARTQEEATQKMERWGIETPPLGRTAATPAEVHTFARAAEEARSTLDFDYDGVVIKLNDIHTQRERGSDGRAPRWAIARKWPSEAVPTTLEAISLEVGRTGRLTPVAHLAPVEIDGVTVRRATLHNDAYIRGMDLRIGDRVFVVRAGEVIPRIVSVASEARSGDEEPWTFPEACPSCEGEVSTDRAADGSDASDRRCLNPTCPAQVEQRLAHFASRDAMDIRGLGEETVRTLTEAGLLGNAADLYTLGVDDLEGLAGFAERSAQTLTEAIDASKSVPFERLLYGLAVPGVGRKTARRLAAAFGDMDTLLEASEDELARCEGIGPHTAREVHRAFANENFRRLAGRLADVGLSMASVGRPRGDGPLEGKTVVCTGTLSRPRREVEEAIRRAGGKPTGQVSAATDMVVAGPGAGSKRRRALELGVPIITEQELEDALRQRPQTPLGPGR